jgi:hypothetical protein
MFQLHRIFCATPWELEAERRRFHEILGQFNETYAMSNGILYVPVTLTNIRDKRPVQFVVDENIRDSRHYVFVLSDDWGPAERNFENDYHLALECAADSALPMRDVVLLRKVPRSGRPLADGMPAPLAAFSTLSEFEQCVRDLLPGWLAALLAEGHSNERHATA